MNHTFVTLTVVAIAFSITACGGPGEKLTKYQEEMAAIAEANMDDCAKMGVELTKFVEANKTMVQELQKKAREMSNDDNEKLESKYG